MRIILGILMIIICFFNQAECNTPKSNKIDLIFSKNLRALHIGGNWGQSPKGFITHPLDFIVFLKSINANWLAITVPLFLDDSMDSTVDREYSEFGIPAFTSQELRSTIRFLKMNGFNVYLTLAFETPDATKLTHPFTRGELGDPNMPAEDPNILIEFWPWNLNHPLHAKFVKKFWHTYSEQAVYYGKIAEEEGVGMYSLGTETERLFRTRSGGRWPNHYLPELKAMVDSVRAVYSGLLTYDMWSDVLTTPSFWEPSANHLWEDLDLDVIGISAYFKLVEHPPTEVLKVDELENKWRDIFSNFIKPLQERYLDKPIVFLEFGYVDAIAAPYIPSADEFNERVFIDNDSNGLDDGEEAQANILKAFYNINDLNNNQIKGTFLWDHYMCSDKEWTNTSGKMRTFSIRKKIAEAVIRERYDYYLSQMKVKIDTLHTILNDTISVPIHIQFPSLKNYLFVNIVMSYDKNYIQFLKADTSNSLAGMLGLNFSFHANDKIELHFESKDAAIGGAGPFYYLNFISKAKGFAKIKIESITTNFINDSLLVKDGGLYVHTSDELKIVKLRTIPASDTSSVSGTSLNFFIEIENNLAIPVFYQWYLNSEIVSNSQTSSFSYQRHHDYEGVDTIKVIVNNDFDTISNSWIIYSVAHKPLAHVLFQADMSNLIQKKWFNPIVDEIRIAGNFNHWEYDAKYKMIADSINPYLYKFVVEIWSDEGSEWKFRAFPANHYENEGWEIGGNRSFPLNNNYIVLPQATPNIRPLFTSQNEKVKSDLVIKEFKLQNYPNPFNPSTTICVELPQQTMIEIKIFSISGREIDCIVSNEKFSAGRHYFIWNGDKYSNGLYFCRFRSPEMYKIIKIMLLR